MSSLCHDGLSDMKSKQSDCKVLVISPVRSHPSFQGNSARILAFNKELLRRGIQVDFLYYGMEGLTEASEIEMRAAWQEFIYVSPVPLARQSYASHWGIDDWCSTELCRAVEQASARANYDAVIVNYVWMSKVLEHCSAKVKILDTHDLFADRRSKMLEGSLEPRWFFTSVEEESIAFERADIVIGIQEAETRLISERFSKMALTVGHPLDLNFLGTQSKNDPLIEFGYFASGNPWNKRSITALDLALAPMRALEWAIAGTICEEDLQLFTNPLKLGKVRDPRSFYNNVECVINPMLGGTGLKIKTIEALSHGKTVVGTTAAFEGLRVSHAYHQFKGVEELAVGMHRYASEPSLRSELIEASRELALDYAAEVSYQFDVLVEKIGEHRDVDDQ